MFTLRFQSDSDTTLEFKEILETDHITLCDLLNPLINHYQLIICLIVVLNSFYSKNEDIFATSHVDRAATIDGGKYLLSFIS